MILTAILATLALFALSLGGFEVVTGIGRRRIRVRARNLGGRSDRLMRRPKAASGHVSEASLMRDAQSPLDLLVRRLLPRSAALSARLSASGAGVSLGRYAIISGGVALTVIALAMVRGVGLLPAVLLGLLAGLLGPHLVVGWMLKRRRTRFAKLFPEAIGLIVRGLKAGLPVSETLLVLGREIADPVGEEFRRVSDEIKLGQAMEDALWAVARRLDLPEFNFLVITMSVQRETGGNLAETLENLEDILRKRRQMRLKVKAMSSEATASAGIIGSLPFVMAGMMFLVSHGYIMTLFSTGLGLVMVGGGATSLLIGVVVMVKMVSFEV